MTRRKGSTFTSFVVLAALMVACLATSAIGTATAKPADRVTLGKKAQVKRMAAKSAAAGTVKVSGWATFSGQMMGSKEDKKGDAVPANAGDLGAESIGSDFIYRPENEDFFWRFEVTKIPVVAPGLAPGGLGVGAPTTLYVLPFSAKGKNFEIRVQSLGVQAPDLENPGEPNVGAVFGLFDCDSEGLCLEVATLKGGYGTTGERIVVALPLATLEKAGAKVKEGDMIGGLTALVATTRYETGIQNEEQIHDSVSMIDTAEAEIPIKSVTVKIGKKSMKLTDGNGLKDGYFNAEFPASAFKKNGPTTVKTRTCLGKDCVNQTFKMQP